jgi:hypothetical protein
MRPLTNILAALKKTNTLRPSGLLRGETIMKRQRRLTTSVSLIALSAMLTAVDEVIVTGIRASSNDRSRSSATTAASSTPSRRGHRQVPRHQPRRIPAADHRRLDRPDQRRRLAGHGAGLRRQLQPGDPERPLDADGEGRHGRRRPERRLRGRHQPLVRLLEPRLGRRDHAGSLQDGPRGIPSGGIGATINVKTRHPLDGANRPERQRRRQGRLRHQHVQEARRHFATRSRRKSRAC